MPENAHKHVILIVDDVPTNLEVLLECLSGAGFEVLVATDGESAIEQVLYARPDLILLDVMMPGIDGFETCRRLKADETTRRIPVIFMTALAATADKVRGFEVGAVDYVTKPLQHEEVVARVTTHLTIRTLQRELQQTNEELERRVEERTRELAKEMAERDEAFERIVRYNLSYSRFVPTEFLLLLDRESIIDVQLGDHTQMDMTLLFADIRDFTGLSELMNPEETFTFINEYLRRVSPIIRKHAGFIDKYMGDGVMALFPGAADDAVQAAIAMWSEVETLNQERAEQNLPPITIGIGLHTGTLMLGTIGEEERMEGTVISDAVNLASRLERLTRLYQATIVVSMETLNRLTDSSRYKIRFLGIVQVKGKQAPVSVFEILNGYPDELIAHHLETQAMFEEGLNLYYSKRFAESTVRFSQVLERNPDDRATRIYLERAAHFMVHGVPPDWTGIEALSEK